MDIRCPNKYVEEFKTLQIKNDSLPEVIISKDDMVDEPIIMVSSRNGQLQEWTRGYENVKSFLIHGYVKITKQCPFRKFKECVGDECQLYMIRNGTGDCSITWNAILKFDKG